MVASLFTASPGLSQTDYGELGGAAHLWCRAIMAPRDKPAITTHSGESHWQHVSSAHHLAISNKCIQHLPVSCVGGPQQKPLRWCMAGATGQCGSVVD